MRGSEPVEQRKQSNNVAVGGMVVVGMMVRGGRAVVDEEKIKPRAEGVRDLISVPNPNDSHKRKTKTALPLAVGGGRDIFERVDLLTNYLYAPFSHAKTSVIR